MKVPVVDKNNKPLMPTIPSRARRWIKEGKATPFWKFGVFCVRLNIDPSDNKKQDIAVGIDPGSKRHGITVKSTAYTFLNIQASANTLVKDKLETRKNLRRSRRNRKTPCRKPRFANRNRNNFVPPSTKARWGVLLRILNNLKKIFPIKIVVVEDICAKTQKNSKQWNKSFSVIQNGKNWFYKQINLPLITKRGMKFLN